MSLYTKFVPNIDVGHLRIILGEQEIQSEKYLKCDGSAKNISDYRNLFNFLGNSSNPYGSAFDLFELYTVNNSGPREDVIYSSNDNLYVSVGSYQTTQNNIQTSTNAVTWTKISSGTTSTINSITYGNGLYVYGGNGGVLATSTDATNWTSATSGTTSAIQALIYENALYVFAGSGAILSTSTNGTNWTARTSGSATSVTINALTYGNGLYVYAGTSGTLRTSTNAINWTSRTSGTTSTIQALLYANGIYVYAGNGGALSTSTNAINWTGRTSNSTNTIYGLAYANGYYFYGESSGFIGTSTDGISWSKRLQTSGTNGIRGLISNANTIVFVTSNEDSTSGIGSLNGNTKFYVPNITEQLLTNYSSNTTFYIRT